MKRTDAKIHIKTFEDLIVFLETNYEYIDDKAYMQLIENTLNIHAMCKPLDKDLALQELADFYNDFQGDVERPLFLHLDYMLKFYHLKK
jgi:hypothetical protein